MNMSSPFEAHERYTDLQSLGAGAEWIEVCDVRAQHGLPQFDANGNIYFPLADQARSCLRLGAGDVAVLFPRDAHAPCLRVENDGQLVRKIAVKVRDALLPISPESRRNLDRPEAARPVQMASA